MSEGAGFAGFAAGPIGQTPASPDMMAIPDLRSYSRVPFKSNLARFASRSLERGLNWQVVSLEMPWHDWLDSPVLYIAESFPEKPRLL